MSMRERNAVLLGSAASDVGRIATVPGHEPVRVVAMLDGPESIKCGTVVPMEA